MSSPILSFRRIAAALALVVGGSLLVATPAQAADEASGAWAGSISVGYSQSTTDAQSAPGSKVSGTGAYTALVPIANGADAPVEYAATVAVNFNGSNHGFCHPSGSNQVLTSAQWSFNGSSTSPVDAAGNSVSWGSGGVGAAVRLWDTPEGTMFMPYGVVFSALQSWHCGDPHQAYQGYDALGYKMGWTVVEPSQPLVDNNPDPNRLVGTTVYDLGSMPGGTDPAFTAYSYKITYDLTRDVRDTDGDTIPDELDNCKYVINFDQANADGDAVGDACENDFVARDDNLRYVTTDATIGVGVSHNDTSGFRRVNWIAGETGIPGSLTVSLGTIVWDLPPILDSDDKPLLGTYQFSYEAESNTGDRDTANVSITLYDCVEHRNAGYLGEWKLNWEPTACFDGSQVWYENLATGATTGITEGAPGNPLSSLLGISTQWTQGPATVFGIRDPVVVRTGPASSYFVEGTSQLCFMPLAGVTFTLKVLKNEIKDILTDQGIDAAGQLSELVDAILDTGRGCMNIVKVRIDVRFNADGTYYTKVLVDDLRPHPARALNKQYTAHHEIGVSDSGFGKQVATATVTRAKKKFIEAWWNCNVYTAGCKPTVSPKK